MSLQYGFNSHGWDKDAAKWKAKFDALSVPDKDYYHNVLSWTMMMTDVGHVSKETIPVIAFRVRKTAESFIPKTDGNLLTPDEFEAYLQRFIGFEANVNTLTDREWVKRFLPPDWEKKPSIKTEKAVDAERRRFDAEIFGVVR